MSKTKLQELSEHGQSVWLDYLSRDILESGKLAEMMERDAVVGVTSNPTIFQKALAAGDAYDDQLKALLDTEEDPKEIFLALSAEDVKGGARRCCGRSTTTAAGRRLRVVGGRPRDRRTTASAPSRRRSACTSGSTSRTST